MIAFGFPGAGLWEGTEDYIHGMPQRAPGFLLLTSQFPNTLCSPAKQSTVEIHTQKHTSKLSFLPELSCSSTNPITDAAYFLEYLASFVARSKHSAGI